MNNWVEFWLHSGGLKVLVQGNGFIPIQNSSPKMVFYRSNPNQAVTAYYGVGHLITHSFSMICFQPNLCLERI